MLHGTFSTLASTLGPEIGTRGPLGSMSRCVFASREARPSQHTTALRIQQGPPLPCSTQPPGPALRSRIQEDMNSSGQGAQSFNVNDRFRSRLERIGKCCARQVLCAAMCTCVRQDASATGLPFGARRGGWTYLCEESKTWWRIWARLPISSASVWRCISL